MGDPVATQHKKDIEIKVIGAVKASADRLRSRLAGTEKAKLDENQEDRDEDAAGGERGAPLLVNQYPPGEVERHRAKRSGQRLLRDHTKALITNDATPAITTPSIHLITAGSVSILAKRAS